MDVAQVAEHLVLPPTPASDVCPVCQSWRDPAYVRCATCHTAYHSLGQLEGVTAVSLCTRPSNLRDWLTCYKQTGHESCRASRDALSTMLAGYLAVQVGPMQERWGEWDVLTVVPSTGGSVDHPLSDLIANCGADTRAPIRTLLRRTGVPLTRRDFTPDAYVADDIEGLRVLVVDDVYVTGTRAQSAAAALRLGGAVPVRILVLGRRINPEFHPLAATLWQRQAELPYAFSEVPTGA